MATTLDANTIDLLIRAIIAVEPAVAKLVELIIAKIRGDVVDDAVFKASVIAAKDGLDAACANQDTAHAKLLTELLASLDVVQ
jgi:hypothetical protein